MTGSALENEALVAAGRKALARCAWSEARALFESALAIVETAEACEGLGLSANWLQDERGVFDGFERAYRLFRERGDARGAARIALALANASVEHRGAPAVANGWLQRAHRLVDGLDPVPEQGWLALWEGHHALMIRNDAAEALALCKRAVEAGKDFHDANLQMTALAVQGVAFVSAGRVGEGLSCLDEAAAAVLSDELDDVDAMGTVLCYLMDACDRVRDYERASQWCARIKEFAEAHHFGLLYSVCRPHYAVVLMWRGEWREAEEQLSASEQELLLSRPPMAVEAVVRMAELRWRQGRWSEAGALFTRVEQEDLSQLGRAELALSEGDAPLAADLADRYLRRIPAENRIERAAGLELIVRARLAAGLGVEAEGEELLRIALEVGTPPLLGWAHVAASGIARARGDIETCRREAEDAVYQFDRAGAPFEGARARLELARALQTLGRVPGAAGEAQLALDAFRRLGAQREAERAVLLLRELGTKAHDGTTTNPARLTQRELDLVRLIASGKSNQEIAAELVLSLRTVERHLSNIYGKLGADGRAARAAAAAYAFRNGLV
jgi:ATP/maltotriose-dependent transcriptional regulator MalT